MNTVSENIMPPKYEIITVPSNYSDYRNIELFSIAPKSYRP